MCEHDKSRDRQPGDDGENRAGKAASERRSAKKQKEITPSNRPPSESDFLSEAIALHDALPARHPVWYNTPDQLLLLDCGHYVALFDVEMPDVLSGFMQGDPGETPDLNKLPSCLRATSRVRCGQCYRERMRFTEKLIRSDASDDICKSE